MKFSEIFKISNAAREDWFDPILTFDTLLFIDPFLIYDLGDKEFRGSHDDVITLFNQVFILIAKSNGRRTSPHWQRAERLLVFPEVEELCLGFTDLGTGGLGSGAEVAKLMATGIWNAISLGKARVDHFEEVQLFGSGIGRDRISDAIGKIIRRRLAAYTERICSKHDVPISEVTYKEGYFDPDDIRWKAITCRLPANPYNGKPILLVPKRFLNPHPTINPQDFWGYVYDKDDSSLRQQFGEDISRNVDKKTILELVSRHPELEEEYVEYTASLAGRPYDFRADPEGVYKWYDKTKAWVKKHPISDAVKTQSDLLDALATMLDRFEHFIEHNAGWQLLWNDNTLTPKNEGAAQVTFLGVIKHYCIEKNIDVSREANIGRGPVDFKLSAGYRARALIEVKKANNSKFWSGLSSQLPTYLEAEEVSYGCFLVICYNDKDLERIQGIEDFVANLNSKLPYKMEVRVVDASRPLSASKLI